MKLITGKSFLKAAAIGAALMTSTSAFAQWQGTWGTTYGDVKLQESGKYVYGDYGTWGTIEGLKSEDGKTMRGVYRRNDDGTSGYFEWRINGTATFNGRWVKPNQNLPKWNSGGTEWAGNRTSTARPRLVVYRGSGNIGAFMGAQQAKYQRWAGSLYASQRTGSVKEPASQNKIDPMRKRFPWLNAYFPDFKPRYFEVYINDIGIDNPGEVATEVYGKAGIYSYCETRTGSRPLVPFGGRGNRVFDRGRANAMKYTIPRLGRLNRNQHSLRFAFDEQCLADPDARIAIQLQTNLNEKDPVGDDRFGYRSRKIYLDEFKRSDGQKRNGALQWLFLDTQYQKAGSANRQIVLVTIEAVR